MMLEADNGKLHLEAQGSEDKPLSVKNNSVGSQTTAAGYVGAAIVSHKACSGRSQTVTVFCNCKGL